MVNAELSLWALVSLSYCLAMGRPAVWANNVAVDKCCTSSNITRKTSTSFPRPTELLKISHAPLRSTYLADNARMHAVRESPQGVAEDVI